MRASQHTEQQVVPAPRATGSSGCPGPPLPAAPPPGQCSPGSRAQPRQQPALCSSAPTQPDGVYGRSSCPMARNPLLISTSIYMFAFLLQTSFSGVYLSFPCIYLSNSHSFVCGLVLFCFKVT